MENKIQLPQILVLIGPTAIGKTALSLQLAQRFDCEIISVDSMQVYGIAPQEGGWLDIGSGGGFPGIVAAIMAKADVPDRLFTLVDSDQRKCPERKYSTYSSFVNVS